MTEQTNNEMRDLNLEQGIKDVITKQLEAGVIEELVAKQLQNGINNALDSMFRSYGDVTKLIEDKIKSVMIPYLENYDYSQYITKLDHVLVQILDETTLDNTNILENFKELTTPIKDIKPSKLKVSELFTKWCEFVEKSVNTDELDVEFDEGPSYEYVEVSMTVEHSEGRSWSSMKNATIIFECEHDPDMNFIIPIYRFTDSSINGWSIDYKSPSDLASLRDINEFEVFLMKLNQVYTKIELDVEYEDTELQPEAEPEADFS